MRALPNEEYRAKAPRTGTGKKDMTGEILELALKNGCDLKNLKANANCGY